MHELIFPGGSSELTPKSQLKTVYYEGFYEGARAEVAYMIQDHKVIFSATGKGDGPSTITGAEKVIIAICEQEQIDWRNFRFFDIQTGRGYKRHHQKKSFSFDELTIEDLGDRPLVIRWDTLAYSEVLDHPDFIMDIFDQMWGNQE